jgi:hypothetical protein
MTNIWMAGIPTNFGAGFPTKGETIKQHIANFY